MPFGLHDAGTLFELMNDEAIGFAGGHLLPELMTENHTVFRPSLELKYPLSRIILNSIREYKYP